MKSIRWQIPFQSIDRTQYRIEIFDEPDGSWSGVTTLQAGDTPFTTEEDNSDDFFTPVRHQTGTIQIVTRNPDGTMLSIDDLLPADYLDHYVRLFNVTANRVEWQGFLSPEAYSQSYTDIPETFSIHVVSVLEAMDSVDIPMTETMSYGLIMAHIAYTMQAMETKSGISLFDNVYFSSYFHHSLIHFNIYNTTFFSTEELVNGDNTIYESHSMSCKEILSTVAQFFGGTWQEVGRDIYMTAIGKDYAMKYGSFAGVVAYYVNGQGSSFTWSNQNTATAQIADFLWAGTNHQRDIRQGAKRVKIEAKLEEFECNIGLQECPVGLLEVNPQARWQNYGEVYANKNETFYSLAQHQHISARIRVFPAGSGINPVMYNDGTTTAIGYQNTIFWMTNQFRRYYDGYVVHHNIPVNESVDIPFTITSYMALWRNDDDELQSGLMICGVPKKLYNDPDGDGYTTWTPFALTQSNAVYRQSSALIFSAHEGFLRINFEVAWWRDVSGLYSDLVSISVPSILTVALQFGNKWLQKSGSTYSWSSSFTTFGVSINASGETIGNWSESMNTEEGDGIFVPIPSLMTGFVRLYIYHEMDALLGPLHSHGPAFDVFISKLEVAYSPLIRERLSDRSSNSYAGETGQAFRNDVSVSLGLASYAKNEKLATMIYRDNSTPANAIVLGGNIIRPEKDLLNRMTQYYSAARQKLTLEVKHLTTAAMPLLMLQGVEGKHYLPLAERRDWQLGRSTITLFETPTNE